MNHPPIKLLFVCSRNRIRSLTAQKIFHGVRGWQVRSAGTQPRARVVVGEGHVGWADVVLVMEKSHLQKMHSKFGPLMNGKRTIVLHIPDDYAFMQEELIDELRAKVARHLDLPG